MHYQRAELPLKLDKLEAARAFFASCLADSDPTRECFWVAHVDGQAHFLHLTRHEGDETGAHFPLKTIIRDAAIHGSAGIVLAHNHPSVDPTPSKADRDLTRRLAYAAEAIDCRILDHLVFGRGDCASFRRMGLL